jgi:hypothetical protein
MTSSSVYPMEDVIRIRTGERGRESLMFPDDIDELLSAFTNKNESVKNC